MSILNHQRQKHRFQTTTNNNNASTISCRSSSYSLRKYYLVPLCCILLQHLNTAWGLQGQLPNLAFTQSLLSSSRQFYPIPQNTHTHRNHNDHQQQNQRLNSNNRRLLSRRYESAVVSTIPPIERIDDSTKQTPLDGVELGKDSILETNDNKVNIKNTAGSTRRKVNPLTPLSMSIGDLTTKIGGKGRALAAWDCYRIGLDPLLFHDPSFPQEVLDSAIHVLLPSSDDDDDDDDDDADQEPVALTSPPIITTRSDLEQHLPVKRRTEGLGSKTLQILSALYPPTETITTSTSTNTALELELGGIEGSIAKLVHIQTSLDGTTKLLFNLNSSPTHYIESVIIPWYDRGHSTLCVSSQVGCRQGCTFCATGRMGKLLDLTTDEILIQLYYANKVCRVLRHPSSNEKPLLPPIDNIVFMGMGEPTDNLPSVIPAVNRMVDNHGFGISPGKITVSTVAPTPDVFTRLAGVPATLAWSVHAVRDELRKELVPTTQFSMSDLRQGLVDALRSRPNRKMRTVMIEMALMDGVNDNIREAEELAEFCLELVEMVGGGRRSMKLMVNLIPFNDIGHERFRTPSVERVAAFQKVLVGRGVMTYVRTTRGDDESAACGQLATKRTKTVK